MGRRRRMGLGLALSMGGVVFVGAFAVGTILVGLVANACSLYAPAPLTPAQAALVAASEAYVEEATVLRDAGEAFAGGRISGASLARVRQQGVVLDAAWREVARAVAAGDPLLQAKVDAMEAARTKLRDTWEEVRGGR